LAREYPQKQLSLHGIDIGSTLFLANPHLDLRQHDLLQPFPESWNWKDSFDIIHQRFLVWGLKETDWPRVVRNLGSVLKPGGRIQLVECKWIFPELWETHPEQHKLALTQIWSTQMAGMDIYIGEKLADMLQELGYEDVTTVPYEFAYGATAKREEDRDSSAELWVESFRHLAGRMGGT
jgi:SAM-dependent methyltransferase